MQVAGSEFGKQATPGRPWGEGNLHSTVIYDPSCGGNPKRNKKKKRPPEATSQRIIALSGWQGRRESKQPPGSSTVPSEYKLSARRAKRSGEERKLAVAGKECDMKR